MTPTDCGCYLALRDQRLPCTQLEEHWDFHATFVNEVCVVSWGFDERGNGRVNGGVIAFLFPNGFLP